MSAVLVAFFVSVSLFFIGFVVLRRLIRRELEAGAVLDTIRDEINSLVVELNQTADRNVALVEERIRTLQELLSEADKKVQLVGREMRKHDMGLDVYNKLKKGAAIKGASESAEAHHEANADGNVADRTNERKPATVSNQSISGNDVLERKNSSESERNTSDEQSVSERVMNLHHQGFEPRIIAQKIGTNVGEVELIISIRAGRNK